MIEKLIEEAREQATWDIPESTQVLLLKMADALNRAIILPMPAAPWLKEELTKYCDERCVDEL